MRVLVVPADPYAEPYHTEVTQQGRQQLTDLQKLVGGYVEMVKTPTMYNLRERVVMLVDEEGLLKQKPLNIRAREVSGYPNIIAGNVVFVGWGYGPDDEWTDVPEGFVVF